MILRNTGSQPILLPTLELIADGAAVTSSASIAVRKDGSDVGTPGGTLTHVTSGVWQYTPTAGETDCGILGLILTASGARPVVANVLTTRLPVQTATNASGGLPACDANGRVSADATAISGDATAADNLEAAADGTGYNLGGGSVVAASVTGAVGSVTGNVGGNVAGSVGSVTAGVTLATNAVTAAAVAADAVTEIQAGLATAANQAAIIGWIDTEVAAIKAKTDNLPASPAATSDIPSASAIASQVRSELGTELGRIDAAISTRATPAQVNAECDTALADYDAPTKAELDSAVSTIRGVDSDTLKTLSDQIDGVSSGGGLDAAGVRAAVGLAAANLDTQLAAIATDAAAAAGASGGSGARSVTITVNDGSAALEGARVRLTKGAESYILATNASGVATFSLDDGTWSVVITLAGYTFTPTTLVVDGTETRTYSMTAVSITASGPGLTTGYWTCLDASGAPVAGVTHSLRMLRPPTTDGYTYTRETRTTTSAATTGLTQFAGLVPGATYEIRRAAGQWKQVTIPSNAGATTALDEVLG